MKTSWMRFLQLATAFSLVSSLALADHGDKDKDKGKDHGGEKGRPASADPKHDDAKRDGGAKRDDDGDDEDDAAADGGKAGRRTPAQLNFRKDVWERREKAIEQRVHRGGKKMSEAEKEAVKRHWLNVGRLLRIRELAQEDKNDAIVKRVDALLEKMEKHFDAKLEKLEKADGGAK